MRRASRRRAPLGAHPIFDRPQEPVRIESKSRLLLFQRLSTEIAGLVQGRQQRQADAGGRRGRSDRLPQAVGSGVEVAVRLTVQVVKLRHRGIAGLEHLDEQLRREHLQVLRRDAIRERVHGLAPGPEAVAGRLTIFRRTGHAALKGMAVRIWHPGDDEARHALHIERRCRSGVRHAAARRPHLARRLAGVPRSMALMRPSSATVTRTSRTQPGCSRAHSR